MNILYSDTFTKTTTKSIATKIFKTLGTQGYFILGLSGGNTPKHIYELLSQDKFIDWSKVYITFSDERCVGPEHNDSNYKMAKDIFLSKIDIPADNILRMKGELEPNSGALDYEEQLKDLQNKLGHDELIHDLLLLGLGTDGHTASLFPQTRALDETKRLCVANNVPQLNTTRLTLTYPIINNSKEVLFLVSGKSKIAIVNEILSSPDYPAAKVAPINGQLTWILDWLPDVH